MPLPKLDVRASYTVDDRANFSSRNAYRQYINDAYTANPSTLFNLPTSYRTRRHPWKPATRCCRGRGLAGLQLRRNASNLQQHQRYQLQLDSAGVRTALSESLAASVRYLYQDRWAGNYNPGAVFQALGLPTTADYFGYYDFYLASRTRNEVKGNLDYMPLPGLTVSLVGKGDWDFYPVSALGLKSNNNFSIGPDITYEISKTLSMHAYYDIPEDLLQHQQPGHQRRSATATAPP